MPLSAAPTPTPAGELGVSPAQWARVLRYARAAMDSAVEQGASLSDVGWLALAIEAGADECERIAHEEE